MSDLRKITNGKFLDVEYHDLVCIVKKDLHLIHDILHRNRFEYPMIDPPYRIRVRIVSDPDVQISNPIDQLREYVHILQFNYPNDYQQRLFYI